MATRIHRPLKVIAFKAGGTVRQRYELSKQLQDLQVDVQVILFSESHLKDHERLFILKYHFYRTDRHPARKGRTAFAVWKGVPRSHVGIPPIVSVESTGVWIPISNSEIMLLSVYKSTAVPGVMQISLSI
jgi:hypothetical protein